MKIDLEPGTYVVAVSGGVDSMVLLDLLTKLPGMHLIVAHFDHGIRDDSDKDQALVQKTATKHGLPFVFNQGRLGADVSEAVARKARYEFLHTTRVAANAKAIITAHHQDDVLETAIINMLRGTGRRGLSSLQSRDRLVRPLLHLQKAKLITYAKKHKIEWREDSTNSNEEYLRNYVRQQILNKFSIKQRKLLLEHIKDGKRLNNDIDALLTSTLHIQPATHKLDRHWFVNLPHSVAKEFMASWLRERGYADFDKITIERLVVAAKTYAPGKHADIARGAQLAVQKDYLALKEH
jgi:tRNA(Ile)-lysidine synthase